MAVPSPPSSPRWRAGGAERGYHGAVPSGPSVFVLTAILACLGAVLVGTLGLTSEATIGIDLGTTFSVVAVCVDGKVEVVQLDEFGGTKTMPSMVHYAYRDEEGGELIRWCDKLSSWWTPKGMNGNGHLYDKSKAKTIVGVSSFRDSHPTTTVYDAKRLLGRQFEDPVVVEEAKHLPLQLVETLDGQVGYHLGFDDISITPTDVGAAIVSKLKRAAENAAPNLANKLKTALGFKFKSVTISVPVGFGVAQRKATLLASKRAGFKVTRLLEEPVAAAIAFGLLEDGDGDTSVQTKYPLTNRTDDKSKLVLVYDLGGGTLDVAVLRLDKASRTFLVMGASGDPNLGGEDWDRALVDWFVEAVDASVDAVDGTSVGNLQDSVVKDNSGNAEEASLKITPLHVSPKVSLRVSLRDSRKLHENVLREMEVAKRVLSDKQSVEVWMFWGLDDSGNGGARQRKVVSVQTETRDASEPSLKRIHATTKITVTRENLASATVHLTNRSVPPIYDALKRAGNVRVDEISNVVLVGGSSRLVSVRQRLVEIFGTSKVLTDANGNGIDPETAVALGAARSHAC